MCLIYISLVEFSYVLRVDHGMCLSNELDVNIA